MPPSPPSSPVMSVSDWLLTWLVLIIPCVNLIMCLVWAFSSSGNLNRRNFCRAYLIIMAVVLVLSIISSIAFGAAILSIFDAF
jgi:ABC-type sugar transport system permease subunit